MSEIRVIPISKGDLLSSTYHMDAAEFGAYLRLLLIHYDMPEGLPDDDQKLAKWAGCTMKVWNRISPTVMAKFQKVEITGTESKWVQRRTVEEIQKILLKSSSAAANARKRFGTSHADASDSQRIGNATPSPSTKPQPEPEVKTPNSTPSATLVDSSVDNSRGAGGFDKSDSGGVGVYRVFPKLTQHAINLAREKAPGWDIHRLCTVYEDGINGGHREPPKNPSKAFPEWCARYTKGKPPG